MVATKYELVADSDHFGVSLESLLAQYVQSTGAAEGAVPSELLQAATRAHQAHAPVQQAGPSDA
eukprot:8781723-Karenia_brevis.AAC.1